MVNESGMYGKYLRKEQGFWRIKSNDSNVFCYCKHDEKYGGIYAYVYRYKSGVKIITGGREYFFDDFTKLSEFFARLEQESERNFNRLMRTLYLSSTSRVMRTFAL
ncbi:MAG: hypothetical protein ACTSVI_01230 [Promethearchaeota archaeon]